MAFGLEPANDGPLSGLSVVELGEGTAGPFAAKLLGDFGAEVVKIEIGEGDGSRRRGPFPDGRYDPNASGLFQYLNANKFGIKLDLARKSDRQSLSKLVARADVFVSNLDVDVLGGYGLKPPDLRTNFPELIIATVSPYGTTGPWAREKGDELTAYAASGLAYSTPGMPDAAEDLEREAPLHPNCFVAETIAGLTASVATMGAVLGKAGDGGGSHVDISIQATIAGLQIRDLAQVSYADATYNRLINPVTTGRMPNFYLPCKDGYVAVAAPLEMHWERLVAAMGAPQWAFDAKFSSIDSRIAHWVELRLKLIDWTTTVLSDEMEQIALEYQLPMFAYYPVEKMANSAHVHARASLVDIEVGGRPAKMPGAPLRMRSCGWLFRRPAPRLGEHNSLLGF
jgi:crotonobetainyl-CoA:carnitine CoA-transferase CaiB-like acyl-CoA transferase